MTNDDSIDKVLFPAGIPESEGDIRLTFELYKIMVASSEGLVARRQGVNTFFLTLNGAALTACGLILSTAQTGPHKALALLALTVTGAILAHAWRSLLVSFGQLNTGKFVVINRLEQLFPAAIFFAEWQALGQGKQPEKYRTFTSREMWTPLAFFWIYVIASIVEALVWVGLLVL
ncbi:RipA family octameric membrane protein [Glaciihabitans arcticus]|uniref:RipA family octameric membrane protein n=1 Tax=Glaciihabitans arcticus TaxID=2668039 RepID=UPI001957EB34|nr:hypothetical protein [Glaciihabitans arcticus]